MARKKTLFKIVLMGVLPLALYTAARALFEPDMVHKVMVYAAPLAMLPLVVQWAHQHSRPPYG